MEKNIDILNINRSGFESIVLIYGIDSIKLGVYPLIYDSLDP